MKTTETPTPARRRSPIFWVPTAYFGMGLPFVVLNMVAVLMYKGLGVSDAKIAFWTSLIMLPWTLKPLWSPLLEMYRTKKFFVVLTQMVSGVTFGLIALSLHLPSFFAITIALFAIVAFSGATHDVACDGVYMDELNAQEQAKYIGWQGAFYNVAKIIGTGLLVYLAGFLKDEYEGPAEDAVLYSWTVIMIVLGGVMFALGLYHTRMLPSGKHAHSVTSFSQSMAELWNVIRNFFTKKHIVYYICFIILYRFAEGFVMKIVPLFLKAGRDVGGLGLTEQEIGIYYGTFGAAAFVLGFIAGRILYFRTWIEKDFVLLVLCIQSAFYGLHAACHFPTAECASYRRSHCAGVFRIWLRLCGTYLVHDATGGCRPSSDGALCFCIGYHEPGCHVARYDVRICQRLAGL